MKTTKRKVAVVGGGISGLSAAWALHISKLYEVHIYEANDYLGGHSYTVPFRANGKETNVDTGFIVLNTATYPNFLNLLDYLGVKTEPTEMSFGVSRDRGVFEWSAASLAAVFAQQQNLTSLRMWRMIFDVARFKLFAADLLSLEDTAREDSETIGAYLIKENYSAAFRDDYMLPLTAAVWNLNPNKSPLDFPIVKMVRFLSNYQLLGGLPTRQSWLTVKGGAQAYIDAMVRDMQQWQVHLGTPVTRVGTRNGKPYLKIEEDFEYPYDHIIMAVHGDQALQILGGQDATPEERLLLRNFTSSTSSVVLHSDASHLPTLPATWAAWNCMTYSSSSSAAPRTSLTYNMNILQHIPAAAFGDVLVTLNPVAPMPKLKLVQGEFTYRHPIYTPKSQIAQKRLNLIQNKRGITFAGAWTGHGFHEDGCTSGLRIAEKLGVRVPWGGLVDARRDARENPECQSWAWMLLKFAVWWIAFLISWLEVLINFVFVSGVDGGVEHKILISKGKNI